MKKDHDSSYLFFNRILLFLMVLLAAYEVIIAGNSQEVIATWAYTLGFGSLVISGLVLLIIGYETFQRPLVVTIATTIPLAISLGLTVDFFPSFTIYYLLFAIAGLFIVATTRFMDNSQKSVMFLIPIHGISGGLERVPLLERTGKPIMSLQQVNSLVLCGLCNESCERRQPCRGAVRLRLRNSVECSPNSGHRSLEFFW